jgi:hypothetical protein
MPPFLMPFGRDLIFDVVFGRKSIFVYFDRKAFAEFVTESAAGKFVLKPGGQVDHELAGLQIQIAGRKGRQGVLMIGWGLIFRMLIEFQDPETLRHQIVEGVHSDEKLAFSKK